jgi:hypothetical protein
MSQKSLPLVAWKNTGRVLHRKYNTSGKVPNAVASVKQKK